MATIGDLVVNLGMDDRKFRRGTKSASGALKSFAVGAVAGATAAITSFGLQLGKDIFSFFTGLVTKAARALQTLVQDAFSSYDAIGKLASNIGVATEVFSGFQLAASLAGSSSENMNKAMEKFASNLGDVAVLGKGEARAALDALGLAAEDLTEVPLDVAMGKVADGIKTLDKAGQAAVARGLFGRGGVGLLQFLSLGSEGLRNAVAEAERLGTALSAVEIAKLEAANDAVTRMKESFKGIAAQVALALAPAMQNAAKWVENFGVAIRDDVVEALLKAEFGIRNFGAVAQLGVDKAKLAMIQLVGEFSYLHAQLLPAFFDFFGKNWKSIVLESIHFATGGLTRFAEALTVSLDALKALKKSGLLPERTKTAGELELERGIALQEEQLTRSFKRFRDQRMRDLAVAVGGDGAAGGIDNFFPTQTGRRGSGAGFGIGGAAAAAVGAAGGAGGTGRAGALRKGSAAAFSAIQQAAQKNPNKKLEDLTKEEKEELKKQTDLLDSINEHGAADQQFEFVTIG